MKEKVFCIKMESAMMKELKKVAYEKDVSVACIIRQIIQQFLLEIQRVVEEK